MKNAVLFKFIITAIIGVLALGCNQRQTSLHSFNNNSWAAKDSVVFYFNILDSTKINNLSFFFRNTIEYPYRNIFLITTLSHKSNAIQADTAEYLIADKYGKWLGVGFGKNRDNYFVFNEQIIFKNTGDYKLTIRHGMRQENLTGVSKLGLKVK